MCSVIGVIDPQNLLDESEMNQLVNSLARAGEVKGNHAAGIAYVNPHGVLMTHIEPRSASEINFAVPQGTKIVMIHCRLAIQGDYHKNYCNHPFVSKLQGDGRFALCHNGMLYDTETTRKELKLEATPIETDSFIASQILSQNKELSAKAIIEMTEKISGSYVFTILEEQNILWLVKGDNPLEMVEISLQKDKRNGKIIVYGTNMSILLNALSWSSLASCVQSALFGNSKAITEIPLNMGTIVKLQADESKEFTGFEVEPYFPPHFRPGYGTLATYYSRLFSSGIEIEDTDRISVLKTVAKSQGYDDNDFEELLETFSLDEIEDLIYE